MAELSLQGMSRLAAAMDLAELSPSAFGIDWGHIMLAFVAVLLFASLIDALVGEGSSAPPAVRLKSERKNIRQLRLPDAAILRKPRTDNAPQRALAWQTGRSWYNRVDHLLASLRSVSKISWEDLEFAKEQVPTHCRPLLVFVNSRSGGGQGVEVLRQLRHLLHPVQAVDIQHEGPEHALKWWSQNGLRYRVLVCGGDGTIGWVLGCLESMQLEYVPPVGILPLGTGNDLARVLGWGGGYTGGGVAPVLLKVSEAHVALLDRWKVACQDVAPRGRPSYLPTFSMHRKDAVMSNYFGIGVDAAVALDFHQMRERSPHLFVSRLVNKLWYLQSGTKSFFRRASSNLASKITLECGDDDSLERVEIPANLEGIIVLNISSFGGGSDLWGSADSDSDDAEDESSDEDKMAHHSSQSSSRSVSKIRPSMQDQKLEVVGVHGSFQLGAAQVGLYSATRLKQASRVKITNNAALPVQVDGEPWLFAKGGQIEITQKSQALMLAHNSPGAGVATDVVEWALQKQVISMDQRNSLIKEIAHRASKRCARSTGDLAGMRSASQFM